MHALADLFCQLYELDEAIVRDRWLGWERDPSWQSLKQTFKTGACGGEPVERLLMRVDNGGDRPARVCAALRGLDEAFQFVNPTLKSAVERTPTALFRLEMHVAARGRLDSGVNGGALLPRLVRRDSATEDVDHKRDLFSAVLRVPDESWQQCDLHVLTGPAALDRADLRGLQVACVPVIADADELDFRTRTVDGVRVYRVAPAGADETSARIEEIVAALDRSGAQIAVAPEATLTPALLATWQAALRAPRRTRLRLVLAGTGDFAADSGRAGNTAMLLNGLTGQVLGRQDKLFRFDLDAEVIERWGLVDRLGAEPVAEDLAVVPRRLSIFDAGCVRLAILICEDLGRLLDIGALIRDTGISHVLVPVFSRPLKPHRWEETAAGILARETGVTVIVSNSLAMAEILGDPEGGTALVVGPGVTRLERSGDPTRPVCLDLHDTS